MASPCRRTSSSGPRSSRCCRPAARRRRERSGAPDPSRCCCPAARPPRTPNSCGSRSGSCCSLAAQPRKTCSAGSRSGCPVGAGPYRATGSGPSAACWHCGRCRAAASAENAESAASAASSAAARGRRAESRRAGRGSPHRCCYRHGYARGADARGCSAGPSASQATTTRRAGHQGLEVRPELKCWLRGLCRRGAGAPPPRAPGNAARPPGCCA
mmetsp:Transcript_80127/g.223099  ORF Transcript_80127/g.223099 Transcript_80127/m.223099 type:complete len:214 (-) Transcript_80127:736-1377(-)